MSNFIFYTILLIVLAGWAFGSFYMNTDSYIHSLLVIAGLLASFKYVYHLKPVS